MTAHTVHNRQLLVPVEHGVGQRHGVDLIGTDSVLAGVGDVIEIAAPLIPEFAHKGSLDAFGKLGVVGTVAVEFVAEHFHDLERVVPEGVDLHRLAVARSHNPVVHTHVHPCDLILLAAAVNQPVGVHADGEIRAVFIGVNDLFEHREDLVPDEVEIFLLAGVMQIAFHGVEVPEGAVHCVVHRLVAGGIREHIGDKPVLFVHRKGFEYLLAVLEAAGAERQTCQGDHGVPAPVGKPRISRHDGFKPCGGTVDDERVGSPCEVRREDIPCGIASDKTVHAVGISLDDIKAVFGGDVLVLGGADDKEFSGLAGIHLDNRVIRRVL